MENQELRNLIGEQIGSHHASAHGKGEDVDEREDSHSQREVDTDFRVDDANVGRHEESEGSDEAGEHADEDGGVECSANGFDEEVSEESTDRCHEVG